MSVCPLAPSHISLEGSSQHCAHVFFRNHINLLSGRTVKCLISGHKPIKSLPPVTQPQKWDPLLSWTNLKHLLRYPLKQTHPGLKSPHRAHRPWSLLLSFDLYYLTHSGILPLLTHTSYLSYYTTKGMYLCNFVSFPLNLYVIVSYGAHTES